MRCGKGGFPKMNHEKISTSRAIAGFSVAAAFVLAIYIWLLWPAWGPVLAVGGFSALVVIGALGMPALLFLRARGMLSVYAAAIFGSIFCLLPPLALAVFNYTEGLTAPSLYKMEDAIFLVLYFALPGAIGGIVGWITAAGFRIRAL